jgi:hypothetical protein
VLEKASQLGVEMLCLSPHSSHKCQPPDVSYFKSLEHFYNEACRNFVRQDPGKGITKEDFGDLLKLAWEKSATVGNLTSGFRKCGIYPYNPDILADDIFEYEPVPAVSDKDFVRTADTSASTPAATSFEELSPIPVVKSSNDSSLRKGRNNQESAVVTSADYWEKVRESRHKGGKRKRPVQIKRTTGHQPKRRIGTDAPSSSSSLNRIEN